MAGDDGDDPNHAPEGAAAGVLVRSSSDEVSAEELEWDDLTDAERLSRSRDEFSQAVRELEAGDLSPTVISRAEGALTNLRQRHLQPRST